MMMTIYGRALKVLLKKPFKLWGLSLLAILLSSVLSALCGFSVPVLGISVALLIGTAMTLIFLRGYRGEDVAVIQLFDCFKDWNTIKRVLLGLGWMYLRIFLWAIIPFAGPVFAIIRMYQYRLTPYILIFEPEVKITDAINVSTEKTRGYKLQMWLADFVYIAMFFAAMLTLIIFAMIPVLGAIFALTAVVLYIAFIALAPLFAGLVQAAFYEEITGKAVKYCSGCGFKITSAEANNCANCGKPL